MKVALDGGEHTPVEIPRSDLNARLPQLIDIRVFLAKSR
jgi:hypothetical protein